ncbi:hypothetical protein OSTOST_24695, partial [Ostertagia ostertagi]
MIGCGGYLVWQADRIERMRHTCQCDRFICRLVSQFGEVSKLLRPVMLNMAMTLTAWIYVYDMKTDERLSAIDLLKSIHMDEDKIIYEYLPGMVTAYGGFGCI